MQYSLFTHGNVLEVETSQNLAGVARRGWGTSISFKKPTASDAGLPDTPVFADVAPGSWFHMPLTSTLTTFGRAGPDLVSVTLLFAATNCAIHHLHVWDGSVLIQEFNFRLAPGLRGLHGDFLFSRDDRDVDPTRNWSLYSPREFKNTCRISRPHTPFSAVGLSFFAASSAHDFAGYPYSNDFPPAELIVGGAGAQFQVDDTRTVASGGVSLVHLTITAGLGGP